MSTSVYDKAVKLLHQASTPLGFVASINDHDNYKRIWTRDGVVTGLAALLSEDKKMIETFRATLETIFEHQHPAGFMPSNVSPDRSVSYGGLVGRADNPSWAVIGLCQYALLVDHSIASKYSTHVEKCFQVMDSWEYNGRHLLYVPQSGDWADEYVQHGYILFDQLLRVWALKLAARVYNREDLKIKSGTILEVIGKNFWNHKNEDVELYAQNLKRQLVDAPTDFWLMGFNPSQAYHQFDLQANSLALLLSIGDAAQDIKVVQFIANAVRHLKMSLPSLSPAIKKGDVGMYDLENNYAYTFRNHPHEFHNGGVWPVWNGLIVAALHAKGFAESSMEIYHHLEELVLNDNEFNECYHGVTKKAIGVPDCVWSAAGVIIAHQFMQGKQLVIC